MKRKQQNNRVMSRMTAVNNSMQSLDSGKSAVIHEESSADRSQTRLRKAVNTDRTGPNNAEYIPPNDSTLETEELLRQFDEAKQEKKWSIVTRIINILLILACIYFVFLIYGVAVTDYQYTDEGNIAAQKLSVSDIREKKNFETILVQYENCRLLYEQVLMLDYRLGQGAEDALTIAPEYEELLDTVTDLSIKTDAASVDTQYTQLKNMLLNWIQNDIAVYLQNMSTAISENNSEKANNALQDKDNVYSDFSLITSNMVTIGEKITGVDLTDIKGWTPESYINERIKGE